MKFNPQSVSRFKDLVGGAYRVALTCHMSPDGDAMGSTLAMAHLLRGMGKDARVITPDEPPHTLRVLPDCRRVMAWSSFGAKVETWLQRADLIICLDFNALKRLSRLEPFVASAPSPKVLIDHHIGPEDFADVTFSYPDASSTCYLLASLIDACGWWEEVTEDVATCLMGGILTDTGGLQYNASDPGLYVMTGRLLEKGVDKDWLVRCLINTSSETAMKLESFAIAERMTVYDDAHCAIVTLDREDLNRFSYRKGDTEGLVNKPLQIPGVVYSVYLREEKDYIKVSMRSLGDYPVNRLCSELFGGGGHRNAAGGEFPGTMQQAVEILKANFDNNKELISEEALHWANR